MEKKGRVIRGKEMKGSNRQRSLQKKSLKQKERRRKFERLKNTGGLENYYKDRAIAAAKKARTKEIFKDSSMEITPVEK